MRMTFLGALAIWGHVSAAKPMLSEHFEIFLELEQNYNVYSRQLDQKFLNLKAEASLWKPVYRFKIPEEDDDQMISIAKYQPSFQSQNYLYFSEDPRAKKSEYSIGPSLLEKIEEKCCITRLSGRYSFLFADEKNPKDAFIFKHTKEKGDNNSEKLAILISDYTFKRLRSDSNRYPNVSEFLYKRVEGVEFHDRQYWNIFRTVSFIEKASKKGHIALPLQGLFGALDAGKLSEVTKIPQLADLTTEEWLNCRFLEKFARWMARMNFEFGIFHESHTQNIIVFLDKKNGQIVDFAMKDFGSTLFDPFVAKAKKLTKEFTPYIGEGIETTLTDEYVSPIFQTARIVSEFGTQSHAAALRPPELGEAIRVSLRFLAYYENEVQQILGDGFPLLGEEIQVAIERFRLLSSDIDKSLLREIFSEFLESNAKVDRFLSRESLELNLPLNIVEWGIQDIYSAFIRTRPYEEWLYGLIMLKGFGFKHFLKSIGQKNLVRTFEGLSDAKAQRFLHTIEAPEQFELLNLFRDKPTLRNRLKSLL